MAIVVTHDKVIPAGGDGNPNHVQNDDWNDNHVVAVAAGSIVTADIADDAITAAKIAAGAVGSSELASGAVTTAALAANAVGNAQLATMAAGTIAGNNTGSTANRLDLTTAQVRGMLGGNYLGRVILTGTGSSTLIAGTAVVRLRVIGQGGGGGGAVAAASAAGGSSGALLDIQIGTPGTPLATSYSWVMGSGAGAGGNSSGTNGTAGADSTVTIASVVYTAKGGGLGDGIASAAAPNSAESHAPAAGTTSGGFVTYGLGHNTFDAVAGVAGFSGAGGSSPLGAGGAPSGGAGNAGNTGGFGGGGSGGALGNAGGAGQVGGAVLEMWS